MIFLQGTASSGIVGGLLNVDRKLFILINEHWHHPVLDSLTPFLREANTWIPFYIFLLLFMLINFGKQSFWWIVIFLITAGVSDILSSHVVKSLVFRLRPCREPSLTDQVRFLVNYCPMSSSFVSSHASNHFAMATFLYFTLGRLNKWWGLAYLWAFSIAYSQIYVGVHYPIDVLCGSLLGCAIGYSASWIFNNKIGMLSLTRENRAT